MPGRHARCELNFELVGFEATSIQDIRNEIATKRDVDEQTFRLYHDGKETIGYRRGREYVSIFNPDLELDMRLKIKGGGVPLSLFLLPGGGGSVVSDRPRSR